MISPYVPGYALPMPMKPILLKLDDSLVDTIDSVRGGVPRTVWIRNSITSTLTVTTTTGYTPPVFSTPAKAEPVEAVGAGDAGGRRRDGAIDDRFTDPSTDPVPTSPGVVRGSEIDPSPICRSPEHMRAKLRHGRCPVCGEKP